MEISTPGRICLFGEHQDYLGLPVLAMAISLRAKIIGKKRNDSKVIIHKPDINEIEKFNIDYLDIISDSEFFKSGLKTCKEFGFNFSYGFECEIISDIPINSGTSSSSAILVSWIYFLSQIADNPKILDKNIIAKLAYKAEVAQFNSPGGMMDQYSTALGGLVYLESNPIYVQNIKSDLGAFVLGDSLEKKDTIGILKRCKKSRLSIIKKIKKLDPQINFENILDDKIGLYNLSKKENKLINGTIKNRDLLVRAKKLLNKTELNQKLFGNLLTQHHSILRDILQVSTAKIELMLDAAINAGAYGGKINGSGGGGCMFAYCPNNARKVKKAIEDVGGKAHIIYVDDGTKMTFNGKNFL